MFSELFKTKTTLKKDLPWHPALDVWQQKDKLIIEIELPGINKDEIHIHTTSDLLIVKGRRSSEKETEREIFHYHERPTGEFYRSLPLPCLIKAKKTKAKLKDGLLTISLPIRKRIPKKRQLQKTKRKFKSKKGGN